MSLPKFVVLKSKYNCKYLRYISENAVIEGFLQFSGEERESPLSKLEVVKSSCGTGLVHMRCSYNKKYWTALWKENHWWLVARADYPEEDQSKSSCTLFKPEFVDGKLKTLRLVHVHIGLHACLFRDHDSYDSCLYARAAHVDNDECDVFTFEDWDSNMDYGENSVKIKACGGPGGQSWSFEVERGGISKIIIRSGEFVDMLAFVGKTIDGNVQQSANFGGQGGNQSEIILDWPIEYVTSISGAHGPFYGLRIVKWLEFTTNLGNKHGPYGNVKGDGTPFNLSMDSSAVIGFHGRSGIYVDAIGTYVRAIHTPKP